MGNKVVDSTIEFIKDADSGELFGYKLKDGTERGIVTASTDLTGGITIFGPNGIPLSDQSKSLLPARSAIAKAVAGLSDVRIVSNGDSISGGQGLTAGSQHYTQGMAKSIAAKYGLTVGAGYYILSGGAGVGVGTQIGQAAITVGAGWSAFGSYPIWPAALITANAGTSTAIDIAIPETIDSVNVVWMTGGGNTGDLRYSWNANGIGAATTVTNPGGAYAYTTTNIQAPSRGVHTLHLWPPASGNKSYYWGVEPQDSTIRKVRPLSVGNPGKCASDLSGTFKAATTGLSTPDGLVAVQADIFLIEIGTNDQLQAPGYSSASTFTGYLDNIVAQVNSRARLMSKIYVGPANTTGSGALSPSVADYTNAARIWAAGRTDVAVASVSARWGAFSDASANGLFVGDNIHPSAAGGMDMGAMLADLI